MASEPNRPLFGVAFETLRLEDGAFEPNRNTDGVLDVLPLGYTAFGPEKILTVDEGLGDPNKVVLEGGWVDALLPKGAEFEPKGLVGCVKGFTAQVCVLNSSSRFLLFVSGSR